MKILAIAQVEDRTNLDKQIAKQTVQPDSVFVHIDDFPVNGINARRVRIARNHQRLIEAVEELKPDLVWQLEQDTVVPEDCLERLLEHYSNLASDFFGYISGIQVGRHGLYCLGAWHIGHDTFRSVDYRSTGLQQVDATGFYCLLAPSGVWLQGKASWHDEPWGPDVNWGLSLKKKIYVDMDLHTGHKTRSGEIWPTHASTCNVVFKKNESGEWKYKTHE